MATCGRSNLIGWRRFTVVIHGWTTWGVFMRRVTLRGDLRQPRIAHLAEFHPSRSLSFALGALGTSLSQQQPFPLLLFFVASPIR